MCAPCSTLSATAPTPKCGHPSKAPPQPHRQPAPAARSGRISCCCCQNLTPAPRKRGGGALQGSNPTTGAPCGPPSAPPAGRAWSRQAAQAMGASLTWQPGSNHQSTTTTASLDPKKMGEGGGGLLIMAMDGYCGHSSAWPLAPLHHCLQQAGCAAMQTHAQQPPTHPTLPTCPPRGVQRAGGVGGPWLGPWVGRRPGLAGCQAGT